MGIILEETNEIVSILFTELSEGMYNILPAALGSFQIVVREWAFKLGNI
jgi:hypothetical protein